MKRLLRVLLDLLYPPKCVFCGRLLEESELPVCPRCARKTPRLRGAESVQRGRWFQRCVSAYPHEGAAREAVIHYKYYRKMYCGVFLGQSMADCARSQLDGPFDLVTWVPVHRRRRWKRGFDQCQLLAKMVARAFGTPPVNTLVKRKNAKSLTRTGGGWDARREAVRDLYALSVGPETLAGKRVLLVDDVVTTGSTLEETSRVLRQGGAAEVCCVTATRTLQRDKKAETGIPEREKRLK